MDPVELTRDLIRIPSISREHYSAAGSIVDRSTGHFAKHSTGHISDPSTDHSSGHISDPSTDHSSGHSTNHPTASIADHIASLVDGIVQEFPIAGAPSGANVIAISEPHPGKPFILLNGHHDTVAVAEGWSSDPFAPEERNGRLYGLGASDMKAGTAINIALFREFCGRLNLIFTSSDDEESDSMGSFALIGRDAGAGTNPGPLSPYLDRIAGVLITEPSNERIMLGARGRYAFHLTVHGRSAHGARPHLGINAVDEAGRLALALSGLPMDSHPQLGTGSVCTLSISGGTRTLSVPDHCELVVDRHYTIPMTPKTVIDEFRGCIDADHGVSVDIRPVAREVPFLKPYTTAPADPFVRGFIDSSGLPPPQEFLYGASVGDYNIFGNLLPTIVYGTTGRFHHSPDEYVEIESIRRVHSQLSQWLGRMCDDR